MKIRAVTMVYLTPGRGKVDSPNLIPWSYDVGEEAERIEWGPKTGSRRFESLCGLRGSGEALKTCAG